MNTEKIDIASRYWSINDKCKDQLVKRGGITLDLHGKEPTKGFVTSDPKFGQKMTLDKFLQENVVFSFLVDNQNELKRANRWLGVWLDTEDNQVFVDVNLIYADKERALMFAEMNGERAIFDLENKVEIRVKGGQNE